MRPYLAIIKDSFRAAMASRVLFFLLLLITCLLVALAPLHLQPITDADGKTTGLDFYYAIWKLPAMFNDVTHQQFASMVTSYLPVYFDKFVMSIGLLIAIIVTANMIPETFEPGSLNLLLSKPVSRWGLYTAKFFGGCVFILLLAGYLFLGVWLWLGLAMGIWDRAMLLSIPLYVIVFAIYFSVSALVGLLWRSPILAVILTGCFWAFCFVIGSTYGAFHTKMRNSEWIHLLPVEETVVVSDVLHQVSVWDATQQKWLTKIDADLGGDEEKMAMGIQAYMVPMRDVPSAPGLHDFLAPTHDAERNQVIASRYKFAKLFSSGKQPLWTASESTLDFAEAGAFPRETIKMFETRQGLVVVTSSGDFFLMTLEKDSSPVSDDASDDAEKLASNPSVGSFKFEPISPTNRGLIADADHIAYSSQRDEFVIYRNGKLNFVSAEADRYQASREFDLKLDFDVSMTARIEFVGDRVLVAWGNGVVRSANVDQLESHIEYQPESRSGIREVGISMGGRYLAVLYRNGNLWFLDLENEQKNKKEFQLASLTGQGHISTFTFSKISDGSETIWVADNSDRATCYGLVGAGFEKQTRLAPVGGWVENGYRYLIRPLYTICPKPGEFYKVVSHLSSSGDTRTNRDIDLNQTLEARDPWLPLWSGLGFMLVTLFLGCLIFQFRDY